MILIIDNYDSFTYNIVQYVGELSKDILIKKNDVITIEKINQLKCSHIIISPGPGAPQNAGNCINIIKHFYNKMPILGICLGHQAIGEAFGCIVRSHNSIFHGKTSEIWHNESSKLFKKIPSNFQATRYHSLIIDRESVNNESIIINAWLEDKTIMGIEHNKFPLFGVQFHPESIKTENGLKIIENFLNL